MCVMCGENMRNTEDSWTTERPLLLCGKYYHTGLEQVNYFVPKVPSLAPIT